LADKTTQQEHDSANLVVAGVNANWQANSGLPKQINDPLSEALASVAAEVRKLRDRVQQLEGAGVPYEPLPESLQRIMDLDYQI
jgi:hypothetical protein